VNPVIDCPWCRGTGKTKQMCGSGTAVYLADVDCSLCQGSGRVEDVHEYRPAPKQEAQ